MKWTERVRELPSSCFAPVMATGIVSRAVGEAGAAPLSDVLLALAAGGYVCLVAAVAWRAVACRRRVAGELGEPAAAFGFFTYVAATDVLVARLADGPWRVTAAGLLLTAAAAWSVLTWCVLRMARRLGPGGVVRRADGGWFLPVVGLQSLVLAAAALAGRNWRAAEEYGWSVGVLMYALVAVVVGARLLRFGVRPDQLTPPYWIAMGACAISVLAGAQLVPRDPRPAGWTPVGDAVVPAVLWAWATCLLPLLLAAGVWRHGRHRVPLSYEPAWWTVVFPLGMYAAATSSLGAVAGVAPLQWLGRLAGWAALGAWTLVVGAMLARRLPGGRLRSS